MLISKRIALSLVLTVIAVSGSARGQSGTTPSASAPHPAPSAATASTTPCNTADCYKVGGLDYLLLGGIEQSDLSAQDSVTQGFYDLYMEEPLPDSAGSLWFRSRYLGTPSSSDKQNIVAAATDPTGTLTATNLPKSVTAVDYLIGYEFPWRVADSVGKVTLNPIIAFGGTSPLSATAVVSGFQVPDYGTAECSELHKRFTADKGYNPPLPASGVDSSGQTDCIVMANPSGTGGTKIGYLGFSNEDRSNFLSKWAAGVRLRDRWFVKQDDTSTYCNAHCPSLYVDFVVGQDEAFTRGMLRHFVFKADARIPIQQTGFYFFASAVNRFERNSSLSPLILSPVTLATSTASTACTPSKTTICYPSANVSILPYKQPDRDYYRIGIGIDAIKTLTQLFNPSASKKSNP